MVSAWLAAWHVQCSAGVTLTPPLLARWCSCNQAEQKVRIAEQAVQAAMNEFNSKLQRCIQRCQDKAQDSLPVQPSEKDVAKAQEKLAACAADCAQEHEKQVPKLQAGIVHQMKQLR